MITLSILGIITGFVSGFFGIGGGTILVPLLLLIGFDMKNAIGISVFQMVFSSIYGTFLNYHKNRSILKEGLFIGIGGFLGGLLSGFVVSYFDEIYLKYIFIFVLVFSIYRLIVTSLQISTEEKTRKKTIYLIIIGFFIGIIAMSIGVGGSILLTPILASFLYYNLKDASSLGLFFVIFSSIAGFISLSLSGHMLYYEGFIVGIASLIGVYFGIKIKNIIHLQSYKKLILAMYIVILLLFLYKL
ncbi:MAG: sulfite exporter TauE/SafE family protein [Campylobacterota bacterium]|nr:sulfite exporter TauE/SafE family protein [Campylobacterota bacterium]